MSVGRLATMLVEGFFLALSSGLVLWGVFEVIVGMLNNSWADVGVGAGDVVVFSLAAYQLGKRLYRKQA